MTYEPMDPVDVTAYHMWRVEHRRNDNAYALLDWAETSDEDKERFLVNARISLDNVLGMLQKQWADAGIAFNYTTHSWSGKKSETFRGLQEFRERYGVQDGES